MPDTAVETWTQPDKIDASEGRRGHWLRRSTDQGQTWEAPIAVPPTAPHGPIALADGRLLFFGNGSYQRTGRLGRLVAAISSDDGKTWPIAGTAPMFIDDPAVTDGSYLYLAEPHVVQCASGKLVVVSRSEFWGPTRGKLATDLWQLDSLDGGVTWSAPRRLPTHGKPPHLLRLRDGRLLLSYGYRLPPYGQRAVLSRDEGVTWDFDHELHLRDDAPNGDLGYPASVELPDGSLITVYYQVAQKGEKTSLMMTHWRLPG